MSSGVITRYLRRNLKSRIDFGISAGGEIFYIIWQEFFGYPIFMEHVYGLVIGDCCSGFIMIASYNIISTNMNADSEYKLSVFIF